MFRKTFVFGGTLLVAAALVFLIPGTSQAAPRGGGGGHGGGGHAGGFHAGGFHAGGYHFGGYRGGYLGGYHSYPSYGGYHYGGYHYRPYYGYGYYPYLYGSGLYDGPDLSSGSVYDPGYFGSYQPLAPPFDGTTPGGTTANSEQPSVAATVPAAADTPANVTARLPADAEIWFDGKKETLTGAIREFHTPPLTPGDRYVYDVRARWNENGHEVTQTQKVYVSAGAHVRVDFPVPAGTTEQALMPKAS